MSDKQALATPDFLKFDRKLAAGFTDGFEHFKDLFGGSVGVYDT